MSKIIVVYANKKNGKFEFAKEELEALLDDAYNKGYTQGKRDTLVWQSPSPTWIGSPTITAVPCIDKTKITCDCPSLTENKTKTYK